MAGVILEKITKRYEGSPVLTIKETSLEIKDKEFLVLVGPSGCGKSTTLRMIAGLEDITSGTIKIGDTVVNNLPPKDRDIAMVFQNYALYPHMNIYDNMAFGLKLRKFQKSEIDKRVSEAAKILGIEDMLTRKPKQLSGGQRQRVALGRAIVREPKVFLMDEPLSNLDAKLRVQMRAEISKLHKKLATTFVYVTHDQVEAMTMADRIAIFHEGVIQQVASPYEVYNHPANVFVAGFIGSPSMNFCNAKVQDKKIQAEGFFVTIPQQHLSKINEYKDKEVVLGVRPEDIYFSGSTKLPEGIDKSCIGKFIVDVIEPMGAEIFLYLKSGNNIITARVDNDVRVQIGQEVTMIFDADRAHAFDIESQKTIY